MEHEQKIRMADCSCGQVNLVCRGEPVRTSVCHCFECQKRTGSVFGVQARFEQEQVSFSGDLVEYTRISDSGNEVTYSFCPRCSTTMSLKLSAARNFIVIPVGIFQEQDFHTPSFSVYEERQHGWVKFDCQMEHHH
ncbi:GFA family protein [Vibrio neptunius]|uniref:GFA family protein n=1 Tax=Vibrio neptunius TaxID=170651 RepID=UPI0019D220B4|nr:GFA family protein [Vibrio neptunius]MBN3573179.1 GFA family protein [Vibrio neptunius]QXX08302.1 GFA family protein [Vibrio neptunius]